MVEGRSRKYLTEVTLLDQPFVKNDKQTVEQMLKAQGATRQRLHALRRRRRHREEDRTTSRPKSRRRSRRPTAPDRVRAAMRPPRQRGHCRAQRRCPDDRSNSSPTACAGVQAHPAQAVRRGADGRATRTASTARRSSASSREVREVDAARRARSRVVIGGGNIFRGVAGRRRRHGPRDRRLHGHARDA